MANKDTDTYQMAPMSRPHVAGLCAALSDWEVAEARWERDRNQVPLWLLAERYGVSAKTLERAFKRMDERRAA